jgi:hypothetical protein
MGLINILAVLAHGEEFVASEKMSPAEALPSVWAYARGMPFDSVLVKMPGYRPQ